MSQTSFCVSPFAPSVVFLHNLLGQHEDNFLAAWHSLISPFLRMAFIFGELTGACESKLNQELLVVSFPKLVRLDFNKELPFQRIKGLP
jgi:hypothetical protein